ncbi:MAG TPA: SMI1/KNR4 family protein [Enterobacteriaceae bacterium]|nr:SMI1/KNR4 family protein [Enterobacteriaceae bacterium]
MGIQKEDLSKWETDNPDFSVDATILNRTIVVAEGELKVRFPDEYKDYIHLVSNQACGPIEELDYFLVKYNEKTRKAVMAILFSMEQMISSTRLLKESIYEHRFLLTEGFVAIGSNYDDDGDAYILYDVNPSSPTYEHIFHWRYYVDNLIVGDGLGLLARSLREFLHTPVAEEEL